MNTRVKLRPGTQFVPSPKGVHCARAGDIFLLAGPAALYRLIDGRFGDLLDGTSVDELVAVTGERLRPIWEALVAALLARDALFVVDPAAAPPPDAATRHADVLAYAEEHCADPHAAFAALTRTRVRVTGTGPAADSVRRGLAAAGVQVTEDAESLVVTVIDPTSPGPAGRSPAEEAASGVPVLPVLAGAGTGAGGPGSIVVGPVVVGPVVVGPVVAGPVVGGTVEPAAVRAAARRAAQWQRTHPPSAPPIPVGAVLAGSLAARRIIDRVLRPGLPGEHSLLVVHGPAADVTAVPLPGHGEPAELTTPWRGWAFPVPDPAPGLPLRLTSLQPVDGSPAVYGWGGTDAAAAFDVRLALARAHTGRGQPPGRAGAAGRDEDSWRLDGALRLVGAELLRHESGTPSGADLLTPAARAVEATLRDYYEHPVRLRLRRLPGPDRPGLDWVLASAENEEGMLIAAEWAAEPSAALYAALMAALAGQHMRRAPGPVEPGTWTIAQTPAAGVSAALAGLAATGRRAAGERLATDPVIGDLPLACGPIWLE